MVQVTATLPGTAGSNKQHKSYCSYVPTLLRNISPQTWFSSVSSTIGGHQDLLHKQKSYMSVGSLSPFRRAHLASLHVIIVITGITELVGFQLSHHSSITIWDMQSFIAEYLCACPSNIKLGYTTQTFSCHTRFHPITCVRSYISSVWWASFISTAFPSPPQLLSPRGQR